jgi:hypothetical protein
LSAYFWLLTLVNILSLTSLSAKTEDSTHSRVDTISQKVINTYLAKGIEARKLVYVLRKQIFLDSAIISTKDTIIVKYQIINQILTTNLKNKEQELVKIIKKYERERFFRRLLEVVSLGVGLLYLSK